MLYTLLYFLVWGLLFALVGAAVGWALRSLKARHASTATSSVDVDEMRHRSTEFDAVVAERDRLRTQLANMRHADLEDAEAVLGRTIHLDDLTVVDGIGPKIAELCSGIGVTSWAQLARTDVDTLRDMLSDAGSDFKLRDPATWPQQAGMLDSGRWEDFRSLNAEASDS